MHACTWCRRQKHYYPDAKHFLDCAWCHCCKAIKKSCNSDLKTLFCQIWEDILPKEIWVTPSGWLPAFWCFFLCSVTRLNELWTGKKPLLNVEVVLASTGGSPGQGISKIIIRFSGGSLIHTTMYWLWTYYLTAFLHCWQYFLPELIRCSLMLGQFPDCQSGRNPNVQPLSKSFSFSLTLSEAHDTSCGSCGRKIRYSLLFTLMEKKKKAPWFSTV